MNAPMLWIVFPTFFSLALLLIKSRRIRTIGFVFVSALFLALTFIVKIGPTDTDKLFSIEISSTLNILGRSFILGEHEKFLVKFTFLFNFLWGIAIITLQKKTLIIPLGLIFSAFLLAAVSVEPFLYSALIIELAVILSIPLLIDINAVHKDGIIRFLIYQTLAMPFILLAGWFLAGGEVNPVNPEQLIQATLLLGLGFIFWLAVFPFHSWVPMVFEESDPINSGYILLLLQTVLFILIIKYINGFAWLRNYEVFFQALKFLGVIMAVFGAVGFFFQKDIRKMIGYEILHSAGIILISIGLSSSIGMNLFSYLLGSRLITLPLLFLSTSSLIRKENNITIFNFGIIAKDNPIAGAAFIFSLLALAGMPLSIGFSPLQSMYQILANDQSLVLTLIILSISLKIFVVFKLIKNILKNGIEINKKDALKNENILLSSILFIIVLNGFYPRLILAQFEKLAAGFEFLIK